jgi:hypothetical protein
MIHTLRESETKLSTQCIYLCLVTFSFCLGIKKTQGVELKKDELVFKRPSSSCPKDKLTFEEFVIDHYLPR